MLAMVVRWLGGLRVCCRRGPVQEGEEDAMFPGRILRSCEEGCEGSEFVGLKRPPSCVMPCVGS